MAGLLEYTKNGQVTEPPLYRFMRGNVQSFLNSIPDPSGLTREEQLNLAANVNPMMGLIGATAYHGSPYLFDKFNINKVGTGEGAQAYGHGMYFAENPKVAQQYSKMLAGPEQTAAEYLKMYKTPESAISALEYGITPNLTNSAKQHAQKAIDTLKSGKKLTGNMYKVDIPDEYIPKMLQWDKPISEQSKEVKKAIAPIVKTYGLPSNELGSSVYKATQDILGQESKLITQRDNLLNKYMTPNMGMSDAVRSMNVEDRAKFTEIADKIANLKNTPKLASDYLKKRGITGIKYLDEGSRELGQGTSNFVVFDPEQVKILEKGLLGN
jgi:hypothetical protein